jgi:flagellar assembly protein FliH
MSEFVALDDPSLWEARRLRARGGRTGAGSLPTVGELERLQGQARAEARAEGLAEGRARAGKETERLRALAASLEQAQAQLEAELGDAVLGLALDVARAVLHESLQVRRELLLPIVREAMRNMPSGAAQIVLNPADVELVRAHLGEEFRVAGWQIVEDHRIQPGGCRLVSPHCEIDATLASRWRRVATALGSNHGWLDG